MSLVHRYSAPQKPERVVVIGKSGFVGGAILAKLEILGIACLGIGRDDVDLLSDGAGEHLAALLRSSDSVVAASALAPCRNAAMLADNLVLVRNILDALSRVPVSHVVNISSDAVYPDEPVPLSEQVLPAPGSLHGAMHLAREIAFQAETDAPLATLRPSLLYGAKDPHNGYGPNRFRRLASSGKPIVLFGEGEERRDHVLIDDLAEIACRVLAHGSTGALNVATGEVASFADIACQVVTIAGSSSEIRPSPRVGEMPHKGYRSFDVSACKAAFPDFAYTSLTQGLRLAQGEGSA